MTSTTIPQTFTSTDREERDLSFAPATSENNRVLAREQIEHYNEHGFIKPFRAFDTAASRRNSEYFDWLMTEQRRLNGGTDSYAINGYHLRCAGVWDLMTHPMVLDYVQDIIGPDIIGWGSHYFAKMPHDPKSVPWHQDASYWPLTPARTVTVWLAIDDADRENSAMKFLPGTHRLGALKWKAAQGDAVLHQEIEDPQRFGEPVYDELRAGEFSLHADMLAHGSDPNLSARRRCGLTIRYCPPSVRSLQPRWMDQSIICRGSDPTGRWADIPRPDGEDLSSPKTHQAIGGN